MGSFNFASVGVTAEGELVFVDDHAMVEQDLMDFLPSSESSSSEESESSDGLVEFHELRAPTRNRRARHRNHRPTNRRRSARHVPPWRESDDDEDEPISLETHLESGVRFVYHAT